MKTKLNTINQENWNDRKAFGVNGYDSYNKQKNEYIFKYEVVLCFENSKGFYKLTKENPAYAIGLSYKEAIKKINKLNKLIFNLDPKQADEIVISTH